MAEARLRILVAAATEMEMQPLRSELAGQPMEGLRFDWLVTGAGIAASASRTASRLASARYDLALSIGIAGSFVKRLAVGDVVQVTEDCLCELGSDDNGTFVPADRLGFANGDDLRIATPCRHPALPEAKGITVSTASGSAARIDGLMAAFRPDVETMEGAAFLLACRDAGVPAIQLRAISNRVTPRAMSQWDIPLAICALTRETASFLQSLHRHGTIAWLQPVP